MRFNKWYITVGLFVLLMSCALLLWIYFNKIDNRLQETRIRIAEKQATTKIKENFAIRVDAIKLLTQQIQLSKNVDSTMFIKNASIFFKNYKGFQAINWIGNNGVIKWVYPFKGNEGAYKKNLYHHPDIRCRRAFERSVETKSFCITPVIKLLQGGFGVVIYSPVVREGKVLGYVNGVFNVNVFFMEILKDYSSLYRIKISKGKNIYFNNSEGKNKHEYIVGKFEIGSDTFNFGVIPRAVKVYHNSRNLLIILLGTLFSFSITLLVWLLFENVDQQRTAKNRLYEMYKEIHQKQYEINTIIENNPDAVLRIDKNGFIYQANDEFFGICGYDKEDRLPKNIFEYMDEKNKKRLKEIIAKLSSDKGVEKLLETEFKKKSGEKAIVELSIIPVIENESCNYLWVFARDLTEFNELKIKTEQQTKMEAIGKVTGRIAHDFNNILTGIIGYSDMILNRDNVENTVREYAENIKNAGLSIQNLTKDLLQFSRKQTLNREIFDLNLLIIKELKILNGMIKKNIVLKSDLDKVPCMINADKTKMESVILNLVMNANDAIKKDGHIHIKTTHRTINDKFYAVLTVEDDGKGIPENIINKIFEPFFTTKGEGKGTGLGLSIVYGLIKQHGGDIAVNSRINVGTIFEVLLPGIPGDVEERHSIADFPKKDGKKILLIDDDRKSLKTIENMINKLGYLVETTDDPQKAIDIYKTDFSDYDVVIADYMMPKMNGVELLKLMKKTNPALRAVIISDFVNDISFLDNKEFAVLMKPFTQKELSNVIKRLRNESLVN